ncbi:islet cell autoantigen 1 [Chrysoperla carnea]|uniref:islet cell autoantigen 1 n=1 Tax=Chrysoperla carnea TaxID=189513 RepID=UPI001D0738F6|nr:islet cell autoantigen 1 [Chrysoperla carnea]
MSKMQHQFWVTKKCVLRKLGSKEDECVVSSDAELDAKLELFRSVSESCVQLQRIIDIFQERLCILAQEENALGRYLKESSKNERNTEVGKAMNAAGKAVAYVGHQRLALRPSLVRLHHEVETFRGRAITDSRATVAAMEKSRTEYRAALGWMKSASAQLDPESGGLNGFRKAQAQVRSSKANFDRLTLACLQKVDLLAAARCNMFSHALVLYESAMVNFATKVGQVLNGAIGKINTTPQSENILAETSESQDDQLFFNAEYFDSIQKTQEKPFKTSQDELLLDVEATIDSEKESDLLLGDVNKSTSMLDETLSLLLEDNSNTATEKNDNMSRQPAEFLPSQLLLHKLENKPLGNSQKSVGNSDRAAWFDLFAELDPLSNPDKLSGTHNEHAPA